MVPSVTLPPAIPLTFQAMLAPAGRQNEVEKVCVWASATLAAEGEIEFVAEQVIVALALADFELSAVLAAVTVTVGGDGGTEGAVYTAVVALPETPLAAMAPTVESPPTIPLTLQMTPVAGLPVAETVAVNTCTPPVGMLTVPGETVTMRPTFRLTVAEALFWGDAWLTAMTVTPAEDGRTDGAVYSPVAEIVPVLALPPDVPFTSHVTPALAAPATLA